MIPKIVFYTRLASQVGRNRLQGLFNYLCDHHRNWDLRLPQTCDQFFAEVDDGRPQGLIIAYQQHQQTFHWAERTDIPTVFIDINREERSHIRPVDVTVRNDDGGFGLLAAKHLLHLGGFASYGFVSSSVPSYWSQRRQKGFVSGLKDIPQPVHVFSGDFDGEFRNWLLSLEKPTALYVAYDELARKVIDVCQSEKLDVGSQVAVLGTDNDEIICTMTRPELSSIEPDSEGEGYLAAQQLDGMLSGSQSVKSRTILCKAKRLVARASTRPPPSGRTLVQTIVAYIERECAKPITPESIATKFNCSRRLLDLRFRETLDMTVSEKILLTRLNKVRIRLKRTTEPIGLIASKSGFQNANSLKNLFKCRYGMSMRDYRSHRAD